MKEFQKSILIAMESNPEHQELAALFLSNNNNYSRYVIGRNEQSEILSRLIKLDGLIDDFSKTNGRWNNIPVVTSDNLPINAIAVNCSTSISPVSVEKLLIKSGIKNVLNFHELISESHGNLKLPWFAEEMLQDYQDHISSWSRLYEQLADDESKRTLLNIIRFRLTANPRYMSVYTVRLNEQYFEDFMGIDNEVFVDVGGFNGDTSEEFVSRYPDYKKVLFFEPATFNMNAARERLKNVKHVEYFPFGLSNETQRLSFNGDAGSSSSISEQGIDTIDVTTLDKTVKEPVSFIKMDIEGWELKALDGSKSHIVNDKPKMAIAVYHRASDFRTIPEFILSLNPNYDLYLRHYTEGWSETVMYFKPKNNF